MSADRPNESFASLFEKTSHMVPQRGGPRIGEVVSVVIVQIGKDAVFVELPGHRQGFIEALDLRAPDGTLGVAVGGTVRARVVHVDAEHGIRLQPTVEAAVAAGASVGLGTGPEADAVKIALGQQVTGAVHRVETYGLFVQIDGTKGRAGSGLLPTSELGVPRGTDLRKAFPIGTKLKAKVIEIGEGKVRLSVRGLKDDEERAQFDGFRATEKGTPAPTLGTFADLLKTRAVK